MRYYLITVGDKYVASPHFLTERKESARVFSDADIDRYFSIWDKRTNGMADIIEIECNKEIKL